MKKTIGALISLIILSYLWAFKIVDFFYTEFSRVKFLLIFFFLSIFVWIGATDLANKIMGQRTSLRQSIKESLIRTAIGYGLLILLALIVWRIF